MSVGKASWCDSPPVSLTLNTIGLGKDGQPLASVKVRLQSERDTFQSRPSILTNWAVKIVGQSNLVTLWNLYLSIAWENDGTGGMGEHGLLVDRLIDGHTAG